jgi:hypothetical protein
MHHLHPQFQATTDVIDDFLMIERHMGIHGAGRYYACAGEIDDERIDHGLADFKDAVAAGVTGA